MSRTRRGLKRDRSRRADELRQTKFTVIVNNQDGNCWYCGTKMGMDCTREHLLSQALGGTNTDPPGNLKAAHADCNIAVGHLPVSDKERLREIAHAEGREEMFRVATQMRRADARMAFRSS
jgi:5-methylcytosine-specific restriction endonuclease McrA